MKKTSEYSHGDKGQFVRQPSQFRNWIKADGSTPFAPEKGRYVLYMSLACPWAHRVLIHRKLLGLEDHFEVVVVDYRMGDEGWEFTGEDHSDLDPLHGARFMSEIYFKASQNYQGRFTVPCVWDRKEDTMVNNESRELIRMMNHEFGVEKHFAPTELLSEIDAAIDSNYESVNNGVYKCGFARTQGAYEEAFQALFTRLDELDELLGERRFLCGDTLTEADWCLFTTLLRFDPVYYVHFKCNGKHIYEYPNLKRFTEELRAVPGVEDTVSMEHIKNHYFMSHKSLNPKGIVPVGPF